MASMGEWHQHLPVQVTLRLLGVEAGEPLDLERISLTWSHIRIEQ